MKHQTTACLSSNNNNNRKMECWRWNCTIWSLISWVFFSLLLLIINNRLLTFVHSPSWPVRFDAVPINSDWQSIQIKILLCSFHAIHHIICARLYVSHFPVLIFHISNFLSVNYFLAKTIFIFLFRWCARLLCVCVCLRFFLFHSPPGLTLTFIRFVACIHLLFLCLFFVSFVKQSHQKFKVVIKVWVHMQWGYKKVKRTITAEKQQQQQHEQQR